MNNTGCVFCSIIAKKVPSTIVEETPDVLVIKDIAPKAPVHYLIITKKHIENIKALTSADSQLAADLLLMAGNLSKKLSSPQAFRLVVNDGAQAGQRVFHLHIHFLAGSQMTDF